VQAGAHLTHLFTSVAGVDLLRYDPEGFGLRVVLGSEDSGEVELLLLPPGASPASYASTPCGDVVVPPGPGPDAAQSRLIDDAVRVLQDDPRGLSRGEWVASLGTAADDRFLAGGEAEIKLTAACDQACVFCKSPADLANQATIDEAVRALPRLARRTRRLTLSGGEPTLTPGLAAVVRAARRAGFDVIEIQSNGMNLADRATVRALARAGATSVLLSLHAHEEGLSDRLTGTAGGFRRSMRGIDNCLEEGFALSLCHVICRGNVRHLPRYADFVRRRFGEQFLQVVFTLAIPTFRVRSDPGLMPALSLAGPLLREALARFTAASLVDTTFALPRRLGRPSRVIGRSIAHVSRRTFFRLTRGTRFARWLPNHRARVLAHCGLPPCVLGEYAHFHDELWRDETARAAAELTHPPSCAPCVYRPRCSGLWRIYVDRLGDDGITPRHRAPTPIARWLVSR